MAKIACYAFTGFNAAGKARSSDCKIFGARKQEAGRIYIHKESKLGYGVRPGPGGQFEVFTELKL